MYTVYFCASLFAQLKEVGEAVMLAVSLHRASNYPHIIKVKFEDDDVLTLKLDSYEHPVDA